MDAFRITGGTRLSGRIRVDGSKNAALPEMAAALMAQTPVQLRGLPQLSDIDNMITLMTELGCEIERDGEDVRIVNSGNGSWHARYEIVKTMRASICVLGPLLARYGKARVAMPGGCAIGDRPVDLHLRGMEALGATVELDGGDIVVEAKRLKGATVFLGGPFGSTVLGTANVMCAATHAEGVTVIESAACEPEIMDLADMLNRMGASITGAGTPRITIRGKGSLQGCDHRVMPDRIVAGTIAIASAITNGDVIIDDFPYDHLLAVIDRLNATGVRVHREDEAQPASRCTVKVTSDRRLEPVLFTTQPYPGFPTDLQAQMMTLLCFADGNSIVTEKIFPDRFLHVSELVRMGAKVYRQGGTVVVQGVQRLVGAPVMASDLRGSASLVLAGLAAEGETTVSRIYHLDRGYCHLETQLNSLGAQIERFDPDATVAASEDKIKSTSY
ncbi:MAG: UDP-N-acetylglucosamine 1-carboxyvinyltransferase [Phycisphaerales bacterium]|nr:UDP-N-acetylglucosamine 1-carboxyvinyltransferase [Phycisphaerales bacterium]